MDLDFSDIFESKSGTKRKYITLGLSAEDYEEIQVLKAMLGSRNVAEIMRRSVKLGLTKAAVKFKIKG